MRELVERIVAFAEPRLYALFHVVFWALNSVEKFDEDFGKPRHDQVALFLNAFGIGEEWAGPILVFFGVVEALIATLAAIAFFHGKDRPYLLASHLLALILFTGFVAGDVVAADRVELLEHSTYVTLWILGLTAITMRHDRSEDSPVSN